MDMTANDLFADRYELRGLLGAGGMAEVRDAWDTRLNRAVAIKLLHAAMRAQPDIQHRFRDEARSAAMLSHPNIVAVHDYGEHDGTPFIVMERLPGRTLIDVMSRGPMPPDHVRTMLDDVLSALTAAHAAGVLHRDIKPANILLSTAGDSLKVADFGIAKTGGAALTATGQIVGTMAYMSPERVAGAPASVADDLYAVGVMGYEAILGRRAFPQDTPIGLARAIVDDPPAPLSDVRPDLDPILAGTIDRAMTRDPAQRFADAAHMRAALHGDHQALLAGAAPALSPPPRPATMVLDQPLPRSAQYVMPPPQTGRWARLSRRTRRGLTAAAALGCFTIAALAIAAEPFSTAPVQPVGTSTTAPPPTTALPPPPPPSPAPVSTQPQYAPDENKKGEGKKGEGNGKKGNGGKGE